MADLDWTDMVESFPRLEWARLMAQDRGQTADRAVEIDVDHLAILVRDAEITAWRAMEALKEGPTHCRYCGIVLGAIDYNHTCYVCRTSGRKR